MATAAGDVFKEFHALARNIHKLSDGQAQVMLEDELEDHDETTIAFLLSVSPNDGHYKGATVKFRVRVKSEYPVEAPEVECLNSVYHPNIDVSDNGQPSSICVNLIGEDWEPEVGLDGCVIAVLFLFHHPNQDDALSSAFSGSTMDEEEFAANVKASIRGEGVEEAYYDKLVNDDETTDAPVLQTKEKDADKPVEEISHETAVALTSTDVTIIDDTIVLIKTDTGTAPEADALLKTDKTDVSPELLIDAFLQKSKNSDIEQKDAVEEIMNLDLPIVLSEYLLKETRPLEIFSYDWRNVAFSFCHMFKWLFRKIKKNRRNERMTRAIEYS